MRIIYLLIYLSTNRKYQIKGNMLFFFNWGIYKVHSTTIVALLHLGESSVQTLARNIKHISRLVGSQEHCDCASGTQVTPDFETLKANVSWNHGQLLPLFQVAGETTHENQSITNFSSSLTEDKPIFLWHWQLPLHNLLTKGPGWAEQAINQGVKREWEKRCKEEKISHSIMHSSTIFDEKFLPNLAPPLINTR